MATIKLKKKGGRRKRKVNTEDLLAAEDDLSKAIFGEEFDGRLSVGGRKSKKVALEDENKSEKDIASILKLDQTGGSDDDDEDAPLPEADEQEGPSAWVDEDDERVVVDISAKNMTRKLRETHEEKKISGVEYNKRLRKVFNSINQATDWAHGKKKKGSDGESSDEDDDDDDDDDLGFLQSTKSVLSSSRTRLPSDRLVVSRMKDANFKSPSKSVVQSTEFHPNGELILTAGLDKVLRLFQVDGVRNEKVQSIYFKDLPIRTARFFDSGREVLVSGRRKFFYTYDMESSQVTKIPQLRGRDEKSLESFVVSPDGSHICFLGNDGTLLLASGRSKQWVANMKLNGTVRAAQFSADSKHIYSTGSDGQVYIWDVASRRCIRKHADDGCIHGSAIATSSCGSYYATGSDSGAVNIYSTENTLASNDFAPKPLKTLLNLTTRIDDIAFSPDSQMLCFSSLIKKDALRMVHLPSFSVFSNWPTSRTPLHHVSTYSFSPNCGLFAVGNDRGRALLYRLNHYEKA